MSMYISKANPLTRLKKKIENFPLFLDNIKTRNFVKKNKLKYSDIECIGFHCLTTPEFISEEMYVSVKEIGKDNFSKLINVLEKNKVLYWKRHYYANFNYCDGTSWNIVIIFKNNKIIEIDGDIIFPKRFSEVYKEFEKYIETTEIDD